MKKIFNIVSGTKSGSLNIAISLAENLEINGFEVVTIFRKYNQTNYKNVVLVQDYCTFDYIQNLAKYIKKEIPDLIIVHGYSTHIWSKLAVCLSDLPIKVIHVEHNVEKYTWLRSKLTRKLDSYTDLYICVSRAVRNHLLKQGVSSNKAITIYNGIPIADFQVKKIPQPVFTIGMTARFSRQKDQLNLIRAIEFLLKEKKQNLKLVLQGEGKTKQKCQRYVERHCLQKSIIFETGYIKDLFPRIDLFVLSTHYEGLPLVIVEAMAAKVPVIASDVAGVNEIIHNGEDGYLVKEGDARDLAEKIEAMLIQKHSSQEAVMVEKAYKLVQEKFSEEKMFAQYLTKIKKLLDC